jgi:hypothetical protein
MEMDTKILVFILGQAVALAGIVISIYVKVSVKLKELDIRVRAVEKQDDTILKKLDSISESINDIRVEMQSKQDR